MEAVQWHQSRIRKILRPKRIDCGKEGSLLAAPARLVDNQECWLSFTDLVFVDPVGTGLSKTVPPENKAETKDPEAPDTFYWDVEKDLDSLCEFIAGFLSREGRWSSPIHIAGESYGGYRCARLVRKLQEKAGVGLCGAMLISPVIEWDCLFASRFNHGIYDLVTPYFKRKFMLNQLLRGSPVANPIQLHNYEGGHMFYMWQKSRQQFAKDMARLYR